jgi:ribosomal protein S18 acetylase RimI-like enzyme
MDQPTQKQNHEKTNVDIVQLHQRDWPKLKALYQKMQLDKESHHSLGLTEGLSDYLLHFQKGKLWALGIEAEAKGKEVGNWRVCAKSGEEIVGTLVAKRVSGFSFYRQFFDNAIEIHEGYVLPEFRRLDLAVAQKMFNAFIRRLVVEFPDLNTRPTLIIDPISDSPKHLAMYRLLGFSTNTNAHGAPGRTLMIFENWPDKKEI